MLCYAVVSTWLSTTGTHFSASSFSQGKHRLPVRNLCHTRTSKPSAARPRAKKLGRWRGLANQQVAGAVPVAETRASWHGLVSTLASPHLQSAEGRGATLSLVAKVLAGWLAGWLAGSLAGWLAGLHCKCRCWPDSPTSSSNPATFVVTGS